MSRRPRWPRRVGSDCLRMLNISSPAIAAQQKPAQQTFQPEDLFRVQQIGAIAWSPDWLYAAIEISKSDRTLDRSVPSSEIQLLDVRNHTLRRLSPNLAAYLGFFKP